MKRETFEVERKAIIKDKLSWDDVYNKLVNYIKFASKQTALQYDSGMYNSSEDLFQEGQLLLYHCYTKYSDRGLDEFCTLFKTSLWRKLRELCSKKTLVQVDISDAYDLGLNDSVLDELSYESKLHQIAMLLKENPIALTIFKEFVNPSSRTLWEAEMGLNRRQTVKDQGAKISVPHSINVRSSHIQKAMEITQKEYRDSFNLVKEVVAKVYNIDYKPQQYA